MVPPHIVILSTHSLFVEGVASRLKAHFSEQDMVVVDARQTDTLEQVIAAQPTSVIVDATDFEATRYCPLSKLLTALPALKVIRLDPQQDKIQVVMTEERSAEQVSDLIAVIQSVGPHPSANSQ